MTGVPSSAFLSRSSRVPLAPGTPEPDAISAWEIASGDSAIKMVWLKFCLLPPCQALSFVFPVVLRIVLV
jgi:hypothetical protein